MASAAPIRNGRAKMARKPASRTEFVSFDVFYTDGSQRSNRKVPSSVLGGLDLDEPARAILEEQDRIISEKSGIPPIPIDRICRSGSKKPTEPSRAATSAQRHGQA
jgi:hypothetical protein